VFARFDGAGRVAELRAFYQGATTAATGTAWFKDLLNDLRQGAGAPQPVPASWAAAWPELPPLKPAPVAFQWQDDLTLMTCQHDTSVAEVVLRDRTREASLEGPLEVLPRGPENCALGEARDALLKKWAVTQLVKTSDGALVLTPVRTSAYDAVLVWFENDRVSRIVARYGQPRPNQTRPAEMSKALTDAWARQLPVLGMPLRRDYLNREALHDLCWLDDQTRLRLFWEETGDGPRVFTEWQGR
jgi:hypothetical protein